jgi:hypothetical protein
LWYWLVASVEKCICLVVGSLISISLGIHPTTIGQIECKYIIIDLVKKNKRLTVMKKLYSNLV